jgi:putative N-acetylmannosamine-6-phosphate epimerase
VWIVPTFTTQDGHAIEIAFNNPVQPDMTLTECEASLNEQTRRVVAEARAREPQLLGKAKLTGIRCVSAVGNPLAPSDGVK